MVRVATLEDCQILGAIHTKSWQAAYRGQIPSGFLDSLRSETSSAMWRDLLPRPEQKTFLAETAGTVVGFCNF